MAFLIRFGIKIERSKSIKQKNRHKNISKIQQICKNLEKKIAYIVTML